MDIKGMEDFEKYLDWIEVRPGQTVEGTITRISPGEGIYVDCKAKSEGFVPIDELVFPLENYKVGQKLKLQVLKIGGEEESITLSEKKPYARMIRSRILEAYEKGETVKGKIVDQIQGGYRVLLYNSIEAFLPGSHSMIKREEPIPQEELDFLIVECEFGKRRQRLVVSRKAILEKQKKEFFSTHKVGDVVEGIVEKVTDSHALLNINSCISAILPRSEVSHDKKLDPTDVLKKNEKVKVKIVELDEASSKIVVSLKAMEPDPWENIAERYPVGKIVQGTIVKIVPFGLFVNLEPGIDGLVRISEIFWGNKKVDLRKYFKVGEMIQVEVIEVDPQNKRIDLSYKRAKGDPWENIFERYKEGETAEGTILKVLPTGLIVEFEDGISGFVPRSELSWEKISDPTQHFKEGQKVKVKILSIDDKQRRMRLSIKELFPDPWQDVLTKLGENREVNVVVQSKVNSGYIVKLLDYNVEGFMPASHASGDLKEGDKLEVLVLRLVPERRKILVSQKKLEEKRAYEEYKKKEQELSVQNTLASKLKK
ncbi:30S ribosomal protein S1 [Pseudothermotoga thermarum]|uniref:RNA binding S1 domain protein n=1 Tax=Pseudothermotoga thermarum DSM 5069 TaxID=688269 RepID=F7YVB3_9THEM|nr:30S ribosomal protein S1 [Pseudothermotoga thermarum]AEH50416.1 RNA binding S1 domain protein [Pseudothermotoga thermarum DSM 5069]